MRRATLVLVLTILPLLTSAQVHKAWVRTWGGPDKYGLGRGVAVDDSGNVYVAGETTVNNVFVGVVVKYSATGEYRWHRYVVGMPAVLAAYKNGVCVTGTDYSGTPYMRTYNLRSDGSTKWWDEYVWGYGAGASDIALDASGNVYVSGWGKPGDAARPYRIIVVKYSSEGRREWVALDSAGAYIERVAVAANETGAYVCAPDHGVTYLASYDLDGNPRWFRRHGRFGAYWSGYHGDIALDKEGNVYFTSCVARDTMGPVDLLVGAYTGDGAFRWENTWICSASGVSTGRAMAIDDSTGSIFVTGLYFPDRTQNVKRAALIKYTVQGSQPWIRTYEGIADWDSFYDVAADHHGNAYVAGFTDMGWRVGSNNLLMKYDPGGEVKWSTSYMITGGDDVWSTVVVDSAHNVYVGGNITTTWNPYTILLATAKYSQKGKFKPDRDGWQFANIEEDMWPQTWWSQFDYTKPPYPFFLSWPPINATSADFPDWPLFVDVYGTDQCYKMAGNGSYYFIPRALLQWRCMVEENKVRDSLGGVVRHWGGSCVGFALSALLYYNDLLSLKWTLGNYDSVYDVPITDNSRYLVNKYFITHSGNWKPGGTLPGLQAFNALKTMLVDSYTNDQIVSMLDETGASHSVVACSLASIGSGWWELSIYDPNYPGTYMHLNYSEITEGWNAEDQDWGDLWLWLDPIGSYGQTPILPEAAKAAAIPIASSDSSASVFNSPYADIWIRNAAGQTIGFANGAMIDSMPGAYVRMHVGKTAHPPGGYFLPPGDYTASIGNSLDSTTYFALFLNDAAFSFHRQGATASNNERLHFSTAGREFSVTNPDQASKAFFVQSIETASSEETVCRLHVKSMPPLDSLGIRLAGDRNVALVVGSRGITADLRLELAKDYANPVFEYAGLTLEGGASYLVSPVWDSLATMPLCIYVDRDRDGTVDDTLRVENQSTAVPPSRGERIPDRFELQQNYPNPFNPATVVRYQLPVVSDVKLVVYDILGREVSMLVNERKNAGSYEVKFDATGLASGVYIYRLQAGTYIQSRKLVLLR